MIPDADIRKAYTLPADFYQNQAIFQGKQKQMFRQNWHWFTSDSERNPNDTIVPAVLLENYLDAPVLLTFSGDNQVTALSNVCTHRAARLCQHPSKQSSIVCPYHGRNFDLAGNFKSMPGFEETENFPTESDNLKHLHHNCWRGIHFVSPLPDIPFEAWIKPVEDRMAFFPVEQLKPDPILSRDYIVNAHWALYCDNYLEGFHIPFVHPGLNQSLNIAKYRDELFPYGTLQTGMATKGEMTFDLPEDAPDLGLPIAGYYFWLFPNLMLNFYPWGLSVNIVKPLSLERTLISYKIFVWKPELFGKGAGSDLDKVEREDEQIVESVQKGINSGFYHQGRFSATREKGVHHFHRLLSQKLL